ncbi:Threonine synthase [Pseudomonas sp. R1-43-08]|nr:Threonine synthase [Pseudomonas sp. R1-43-08]
MYLQVIHPQTAEGKCGNGRVPEGWDQSLVAVTDTLPSGHRYLHNFVAAYGNHDAKRVALDLAFDLGTPSLGEVPSGGARAFCLLLRFSKVSRRKGGTHSSRYRSNGYVLALIQHPGRLSGRHRGQAPSHILVAGHKLERLRVPSRHRFRAIPKLCRYPWPSGASPNASQSSESGPLY